MISRLLLVACIQTDKLLKITPLKGKQKPTCKCVQWHKCKSKMKPKSLYLLLECQEPVSWMPSRKPTFLYISILFPHQLENNMGLHRYSFEAVQRGMLYKGVRQIQRGRIYHWLLAMTIWKQEAVWCRKWTVRLWPGRHGVMSPLYHRNLQTNLGPLTLSQLNISHRVNAKKQRKEFCILSSAL